jgi:RHS repeat-associated protein
VNLTYDLDGNLTNDGTFQYEYDAENRLISATPLNPQNGDKKTEYAYDYMSRRVQKNVYEWQTDHWSLLTENGYVYDGWNLIREETTTDSGNSTDYYVWGLDLSGSLQGAGGIGGLLSKMNSLTAQTFLYTFDANGNVGQLVDASDGTITAHYEYDPFGNVLVITGSEAENNIFRFSTKYFDAETELYNYGYRDYSPKLGRWTSRDPIGEEGGLNLYGFVRNDPINFWDFLGLMTFSEHARNFMLGLYEHHDKEVGSEIFRKPTPERPNPYYNPGKYPDKRPTDCITYVTRVLRYAYNMTGQNHISRKINTKGIGDAGIGLALYLRGLGWKAIYWNQDVNHPNDGDNEHTFGYWYWYKQHNTYYEVQVDDAVVNYNPTPEHHHNFNAVWKREGRSKCATPEDLTGYNKLKKVMFGVIVARGARHNFLYSEGYTYEVHYDWPENPATRSLYEKKDFKTHSWIEGIIMLPPDNGVYQ